MIKWTSNDKRMFCLGTFFGILTSLLSASLPFFIKLITDKFEKNPEIKTINSIGLILAFMILAGLLSILFNYFSKIFLTKLSSEKIAQTRQKMFSNIQSASPQDLKNYDSSSLMSRLSLDIFNYSMYYNFLLINAFPSIIRWIIFTIMAFLINYIMGFILIGFCLILLIVSMLIARKSVNYYQYSIKNIDDITKVVQENVSGIRVVKSFNLKEVQLNRFEKLNEKIAFNASNAEIKTLLSIPFAIALVNSIAIIILVIAALNNFKSFSPIINYGDIAALITYSYLIFYSTFDVVFLYVFYSRSSTSQKRIKELLNIEFNSLNDNGINFQNGDIIFNNVSFKYNEHSHDYVLRKLNFQIKKNAKIGILGQTGSGKTTLLYLIARLWNPLKGNILINDCNINDIKTKSLLENISFAFQDKLLFSGTIKDNIKFSNNNISDLEINKILELCQLKEFIDSNPEKLEYKLEEMGQNLSGGQKQRLNIARALARDASIYIFDDTTSALDNITEQKILKSILENKKNSTLIISSQKISTIQKMDQIIVLDKGQISDIGNHDYLLKHNSIYQDIYYLQNKRKDINA